MMRRQPPAANGNSCREIGYRGTRDVTSNQTRVPHIVTGWREAPGVASSSSSSPCTLWLRQFLRVMQLQLQM